MEKLILTTSCLMLGIDDDKVARRAGAPLVLFSSLVCTTATEARLFGRCKEEDEDTAPLAKGGSGLLPFSRAFFASFFTMSPSTLFFIPSARAPLAGKERL